MFAFIKRLWGKDKDAEDAPKADITAIDAPKALAGKTPRKSFTFFSRKKDPDPPYERIEPMLDPEDDWQNISPGLTD